MGGDRGQAFPVYITVVAGLLFLAVAYFAFGQAAVSRNGVQGAADAAALAAAYDTRDQLGEALLDSVANPDDWKDLLNGHIVGLQDPCAAARQFAESNGADALVCEVSPWPPQSVRVEVKALDPVGDTVVPGTEGTFATANARALLEPRCVLTSESDAEGDPAPIELDCDGDSVTVDPEAGDSLPDLDIMFSVRLID
ncbi:pilus assembly protein TadG-related protein [Streptomyces sp. JJ38]|uniref:pilus assembly protein TadG-related protein n=1 Tax=Streptomyces sp. JJ38 TaxID=2738128 RepID=UPI001C598563|nr:pilus assembly protein TadG-related protein [Streptomyces sp. JJ38]MBW1597365.1 hypothetical protein [Streptomyces sp. JJ38]